MDFRPGGWIPGPEKFIRTPGPHPARKNHTAQKKKRPGRALRRPWVAQTCELFQSFEIIVVMFPCRDGSNAFAGAVPEWEKPAVARLPVIASELPFVRGDAAGRSLWQIGFASDKLCSHPMPGAGCVDAARSSGMLVRCRIPGVPGCTVPHAVRPLTKVQSSSRG